jgi:hypothetical protein
MLPNDSIGLMLNKQQQKLMLLYQRNCVKDHVCNLYPGFFSSRTNEAKSPHSGKMEFFTKPKPEEVINEAYHIGS